MKYSCRMLSQCDPSKTMRSFAFLVVFPTLWVSLSCSVIPHTSNTTTLKLIHVVSWLINGKLTLKVWFSCLDMGIATLTKGV